ncbi:ABC transporter ATP-binding protein [Brochothrix thermosphacta]|uniref:ABC transporter ATP-binding protein n=1 Tax=Brochothrix thermosphacta TaxID=2756 RepID=A0A1D2KZ26_BROTH|nr:ATP-binding cassette domain-containing protein [Brochothrix thermosphacta]ATF27022.1 ABC transporter ATP-binding protein [Brochothrix thermosphacta]ATH86380.1 ABC transporter ATP-binding protein [Brochothrix thermosphacta]ODJ62984.1 ABC transporter ATP-binding protein [Brochothrix thermosphacta]ODJ68132.1 ABC transporter ATP-binding protein [Brochothrix thermosphacta]ODJ72804.1 ABC transporter ATP-binding protein [Brochothrix thermosphacta]
MSKKIVLQTNNLNKNFSDFCSVNNLSISVKEKEIYGFLGPNGAGKSTTMKMILGLLKPSKGNIQLFNKDLKKNKQEVLKDIGALIEEPSYYSNLIGLENLQIMQRLLQLPEKNITEALRIVRLTAHQNKLAKNYSLGMKQRLGIALAIIKFPKLLILDEPTNGLDPAGIQEIRELIKSFPKEYGMTVFISSHLLSEVEQMATTVGIINQGKLLFQGDLSELEEKPKIEFHTNQNTIAIDLLDQNGFRLYDKQSNKIQLINNEKEQIANAVNLLVENKVRIYQVKPVRKSLEKIFLEMTSGKEGEL